MMDELANRLENLMAAATRLSETLQRHQDYMPESPRRNEESQRRNEESPRRNEESQRRSEENWRRIEESRLKAWDLLQQLIQAVAVMRQKSSA